MPETARQRGCDPLRFPVLDIVRGLAAFWVVAFHCDFGPQFRESLPLLHDFFRAGFLGVHVFFVVSGYCIANAALRGLSQGETPATFLTRRLWRIYPTFWCSILFVAAMPYVKAIVLSRGLSGLTTVNPLFAEFTVFDWLSVATLLQIFRDTGPSITTRFENINVVYWTLALEVQFYILATMAYSTRKAFWLVVLGFGLFCLPWCVFGPPAWLNPGFCFSFWPLFCLGALLCLCNLSGWTIPANRAGTWISATAALLLAGVSAWYLASGRFEWAAGALPHQLATAAVTAALLWLLIPLSRAMDGAGLFRTRLAWPFVFLGAMSYSVYLVHFNLGKIPVLLFGRILPVGSIWLDGIVLVSTVLLCVPFYMLCEAPVVRAGRGRRRMSNPVQEPVPINPVA
jgi:peptidoglycan/LPS O-acetylase OafA/YrhL